MNQEPVTTSKDSKKEKSLSQPGVLAVVFAVCDFPIVSPGVYHIAVNCNPWCC